MGQNWSSYVPQIFQNDYKNFVTNCATVSGQDLSSPLACPSSAYWKTLSVKDQTELLSLNTKMMEGYNKVRDNIISLCDASLKNPAEQENLFQAVWPTFYWLYNSQDGKRMVDEFLAVEPGISLPDKAKQTIKQNYMDDTQRRYQLLNANAYDGIYTEVFTLFYTGVVRPADWDGALRDGAVKCTLRETNDRQSWPKAFATQYWGVVINQGNPLQQALSTKYNVTLGRFADPGAIGNPFWTQTQRQQALRKAMPTTASGTNFLDVWNQIYIETGQVAPGTTYEQNFDPNYKPGIRGAYYDDPTYGGMMPKMVLPFNPGNAPAEKDLTGGAGSKWTNPCNSKSGLETIIPVAAAVFGTGAVYFILGRSPSTHVAAATAGLSMYYMAKQSYGWDALTSIGSTENSDTAGTILSIGAPAALVLFASENGIDVRMDPKFAAAGAALIGYMFLREKIQTSLVIGGGISTVLTAPIALIDKFITIASNGCLAQEFLSPWVCTCKEADLTGGKTVIRDAWLDDIYGVTGQQRKLRSACLDAEMRRAGWASTGSDPNVVSKCSGVQMDNPFACYTAATWAYRAPAVPSRVRTDPQEIDMWNQVSHCLDAGNPSFLPPQTDADRACQRQFGEQFRAASDGTCRNWALPGPNNTDPVGLQSPGAVKPAVDSSCTIL
jgi:hypothetical protein